MNDADMLKETYRLVVENNKMLRRMRRAAFWGGIIRLVIYAALLAFPLFLYFTYLAPILESFQQTMQELQGTGASAQAQFGNLQEMFQELQERFR